MTCCAAGGEIIVVPAEGGPGAFYKREAEEFGLPSPTSSFDDFVASADSGTISDEERRRMHDMPRTPFVITVDDDEADDWAQRLRAHPGVAAATRNWRVSLACPSERTFLKNVDVCHLADFLARHGLGPWREEGERAVRVGILDSGVAPTAVPDRARLDPRQFEITGTMRCTASAPSDTSGHGSGIAAIIHALAPTATITSIRCFGGGGGSLVDIVYAMFVANLLEPAIDIFNLSFSVDASVEVCPHCQMAAATNDDRRAMVELLTCIDDARLVRPIHVAAGGRRPTLAVPAATPGVFAVGSTGGSQRHAPAADPSYATIAAQFILAPGGTKADPPIVFSDATRLWGTSFATAIVSGLAARALGAPEHYGIPDTHDEPRRDALWSHLAADAWRSYPGYDPARDGVGVTAGVI